MVEINMHQLNEERFIHSLKHSYFVTMTHRLKDSGVRVHRKIRVKLYKKALVFAYIQLNKVKKYSTNSHLNNSKS